jgi:hypothetical protein
MLHRDLLEQAHHLATRDKKKPKQANLRRALSTAYYALFHLLVGEATRHLLRGGLATHRRGLARAFTHDSMKNTSLAFAEGGGGRLSALGAITVPQDLKVVAQALVDLQQARHEADYDRGAVFKKTETLELLGRAEEADRAWGRVRKQEVAGLYLLLLLAYPSLRAR